MIWDKIANDHSTLQEYRLTDNNQQILVLKYNPLHNSARVTFGNSHRLFFMESAGSFSGKTTFTNEYGLETGDLVFEGVENNKGSLSIDNKHYSFKISRESLDIFESNEHQPLAICELRNNSFLLSSTTNKIDIACYLLGICWYLFLPFTKRVQIHYATAS